MDRTNGTSMAPDPTAQRDRNRELYDQRVAALSRLNEAELNGDRVAARRAKTEADAALAALHSENQRLVAAVCRPFRSDDDRQAYKDYLDAGSLALFEAILSWDPAKAKLGYWSTKHVRKAVFSEVARREHRLSRHAFAVRQAVHASATALRERLGRWPSNTEVSEDSGLPIGVVSRIREADTRGKDPSLDAPIGDNGLTLADVISDSDDTVGTPLEFTKEQMKRISAGVKAPALWCAIRHHGMDGTWGENFSAVAALLDVSREPPRKLVKAFTDHVGECLANPGILDGSVTFDELAQSVKGSGADDTFGDGASLAPRVLEGQGHLFT